MRLFRQAQQCFINSVLVNLKLHSSTQAISRTISAAGEHRIVWSQLANQCTSSFRLLGNVAHEVVYETLSQIGLVGKV